MSVSPLPPVSTVFPVSPPNWKTKSALLVVETPVLHGFHPGQLRFAWRSGRVGFASNGVAVLAPETPNAMTPYHVSPVKDVWTEIMSSVNGVGAIAYHVCTNWLPPMPKGAVLA